MGYKQLLEVERVAGHEAGHRPAPGLTTARRSASAPTSSCAGSRSCTPASREGLPRHLASTRREQNSVTRWYIASQNSLVRQIRRGAVRAPISQFCIPSRELPSLLPAIPIGGYSRGRAKTQVALRDWLPRSARVLSWWSSRFSTDCGAWPKSLPCPQRSTLSAADADVLRPCLATHYLACCTNPGWGSGAGRSRATVGQVP
jgi:hypothetical protein